MAQPTLPLVLTRGSGTTLAVQLAAQVRALIRTGTPSPGDRLPSNRALAVDLGIARAVVEQAYDQLIAEGWLTTRRGAGTFVADVGSSPPAAPNKGRVAAVPSTVACSVIDMGT